jgi:hypothetical protein
MRFIFKVSLLALLTSCKNNFFVKKELMLNTGPLKAPEISCFL